MALVMLPGVRPAPLPAKGHSRFLFLNHYGPKQILEVS